MKNLVKTNLSWTRLLPGYACGILPHAEHEHSVSCPRYPGGGGGEVPGRPLLEGRPRGPAP